MLGTDICGILAQDHQVAAYDIEDFDIRDHKQTLEALVAAAPEVVLHLAAFTDVEACEEDRRAAFESNALGTLNVAAAARQAGALLVYISTDYVFDGRKAAPYTETDQPAPLNFYGLTKLYGERYVGDLTLSHLIVRTSWLFGPHGRNFVDTIVGMARAGGNLEVVSDQRGCPTYTGHLAQGIKELIERRVQGIAHLTNSGEATWFELARHALELAGIEADLRPVSSRSYPTKAVRPAYSVLGSQVLDSLKIRRLPPWQQGVREHLRRKGLLNGGGN